MSVNSKTDRHASSCYHKATKQETLKIQEKHVAKAIKTVLKYCNIFFWKNWGNPMMATGIPDYVGVVKIPTARLVELGIQHIGVLLAIETKAPGKIPNAQNSNTKTAQAQIQFINEINQRGGLAFFCDGIDSLLIELAKLGIKFPIQSNILKSP